MTPTMHALRGARYKYVHYYGIWDIDELYNLEEDPLETNNLISNPNYKDVVQTMNKQLFDVMQDTGAMSIPLFRDSGGQSNHRGPKDSAPATFPADLLKAPPKPKP